MLSNPLVLRRFVLFVSGVAVSESPSFRNQTLMSPVSAPFLLPSFSTSWPVSAPAYSA